MPPSSPDTQSIKHQVLEANRQVHALENRLYLARHPEQTNFFQTLILENAVESVCAQLDNPDSRVLDLGCGTGYLYLKFLARGYRMTGVDLSDVMIRVLQDSIPEEARARSRLVVADVEEFAARSNEDYEAVVLSALLHHLYDYETVIRKVAARVRTGGVLLILFEPLQQKITSPLRYTLHRWLSQLDEAFYQREMRAREIPLFDEDYQLSDYQRRFGGIDPHRLTALLEGMGMEILQMQKYCARRYGLPAFLATRLLRTQNTFNLLVRKKTA